MRSSADWLEFSHVRQITNNKEMWLAAVDVMTSPSLLESLCFCLCENLCVIRVYHPLLPLDWFGMCVNGDTLAFVSASTSVSAFILD